MSQENVEVVRAVYEAGGAGDLPRAMAGIHPEIVWEAIESAPDFGTYRGHEGVTAYMQGWLDDFYDMGMELREVIEAGDRLVIVQRGAATGRGSDARGEIDYAVVYAYRDGKLFRVNEYATKEEALEAVGLEG